VDVAHYLLIAAVIPFLVGFPAYAVFSAVGLRGLPRTIYSPAATIALIAALAGAAILLPISFMVASWTIVGLLIAAAVCGAALTAGRRGWGQLLPAAEERTPLLLLVAAFAFLAGFNLMTSNPPGSINPCAPVPPGQQGYLPVNTGGPCAVVAPAGLTMARIPERAQDDLLQFRTAQAIWNRKLYSDREFSGGWLLQDRTPLVGLVTAGLGATSGRAIPSTYPPQVAFPQFGPTPLWLQKFGAPHDSSITPKTQPSAFTPPGYQPPLIDRWGYWFYRLLAMFLNTLVVLPTFALGTVLAGRRVGTLAAIAASLSPAIMENAYYTSPKYLGVYFAFCALLLVMARRPAFAGSALGASYLCHPLGSVLAASVVLYQIIRREFRDAVVIVAAALVILAPWFAFTAAKGQSSNLVGYPLGCVGPSVKLDACWHNFINRPVSETVWLRAEILPALVISPSLSPREPLQPPSRDGLLLKWMTAHDFAYPGMVGFAFFIFVVLGGVRFWPREKRLLAAMVGGQLFAIVVIWGLPGWPPLIVGLGLLPILYVLGAFGLVTAGPRTARIGALLIAAEWLIYLGALYRPIENVDAGQFIFGWILILGALAWMGRSAWSALRPAPETRWQPTATSPGLDLHAPALKR
jgi:hypothetical protein